MPKKEKRCKNFKPNPNKLSILNFVPIRTIQTERKLDFRKIDKIDTVKRQLFFQAKSHNYLVVNIYQIKLVINENGFPDLQSARAIRLGQKLVNNNSVII